MSPPRVAKQLRRLSVTAAWAPRGNLGAGHTLDVLRSLGHVPSAGLASQGAVSFPPHVDNGSELPTGTGYNVVRPSVLPSSSSLPGAAQRRSLSAGAFDSTGSAVSATANPLVQLEDARRRYKEEVSVLRKQYAAEYAEKQREKARAEKEKRDRMKRAQESEVEARREQEAARRQLLLQQQEELRQAKEFQRLVNEAWRLETEARHEKKKEARISKIQAESRYWIKEVDIDRRISEAFSDPYILFPSSDRS